MYETILDDSVMSKVEEVIDEVDKILENVDIVDSITNPTGLYKYCRDLSEKRGKHIYKEKIFKKKDEYGNVTEEKEMVYSHYVPNDPDVYNIVVTDHLSLLSKEENLSLHERMGRWSSDYCKKQISKHWKWIVLNIQQLQASGEDVTHFKHGRVEPSLDKAANNKEIIRDDYVVISLFAPDRYEIPKHSGYNVKELKDNYRSLAINKNRMGKSNLKLGIYFDGATGRFKELPLPNSPELNKVYELQRKIQSKTR